MRFFLVLLSVFRVQILLQVVDFKQASVHSTRGPSVVLMPEVITGPGNFLFSLQIIILCRASFPLLLYSFVLEFHPFKIKFSGPAQLFAAHISVQRKTCREDEWVMRYAPTVLTPEFNRPCDLRRFRVHNLHLPLSSCACKPDCLQ